MPRHKKGTTDNDGDGKKGGSLPANVKIICTCDRLPLETGEVLVRDMTATVPTAHAEAYEAQGRARRG